MAGMDKTLIGGAEKRKIIIVDYDQRWQEQFQRHAQVIALALGENALAIEHVGSTSVPELAAKPIIDILVVVKDSGLEASYLPALVEAGYVLRVREPDWHQHRMFRTPERDVHIHVFSAGCVEIRRLIAFRDRLRISSEDRSLYEPGKRKLAKEEWPNTNDYARAKSDVVEQIIDRALREVGDSD
jgi:GrpB-like predicted nucleotidyltransferase (UPF0157 family)